VSWTHEVEETLAILEYLRLRKLGLIVLVLAECGRYYVTEEIDPWGNKMEISRDEFIKLVRRVGEEHSNKKESEENYGERKEAKTA